MSAFPPLSFLSFYTTEKASKCQGMVGDGGWTESFTAASNLLADPRCRNKAIKPRSDTELIKALQMKEVRREPSTCTCSSASQSGKCQRRLHFFKTKGKEWWEKRRVIGKRTHVSSTAYINMRPELQKMCFQLTGRKVRSLLHCMHFAQLWGLFKQPSPKRFALLRVSMQPHKSHYPMTGNSSICLGVIAVVV